MSVTFVGLMQPFFLAMLRIMQKGGIVVKCTVNGVRPVNDLSKLPQSISLGASEGLDGPMPAFRSRYYEPL